MCVVLKNLSDVTYLIGIEKVDNRVVHHDKLKRYEGQNRPKWKDRAVRSFVNGNKNLGQCYGSKVKVKTGCSST